MAKKRRERGWWETLRFALPGARPVEVRDVAAAAAAELEPARVDTRHAGPVSPAAEHAEAERARDEVRPREPDRETPVTTPRRPTPARWVDRIPMSRRRRHRD